jgi:hypothetical protein
LDKKAKGGWFDSHRVKEFFNQNLKNEIQRDFPQALTSLPFGAGVRVSLIIFA